MTDLTQQLLDDFKPYIKKDFWDEFVKKQLEQSKPENDGPVVKILVKYYPGTERIYEKIYQRQYAYERGIETGSVLNAARVKVDSL